MLNLDFYKSFFIRTLHTKGHVGPPIPCCKVKLIDVPEMNYFAKDGRGEVCFWGYNVFRGYFKDELNTKLALDDEGWLHTGDIGCWTPEGTLKLIDRKKHIFKLSQVNFYYFSAKNAKFPFFQGEYIAPEKIETVYARCKFIAQCYVHGESLKSCLVSVVVPDQDVLMPYAEKELNIKNVSFAELCKNEARNSRLIIPGHMVIIIIYAESEESNPGPDE